MYGKTFTTLWEGSMVGLADAQLVFIFLFCHCDLEGFVEAHPSILSAKTGIPLDRVRAALDLLQAPDPNSRSKAEEGRRIIPLNADRIAGWKVVNYEYYRSLRKADDRREYQRRYWHSRKINKSQPQILNHTQPHSTYAEAEVDADAIQQTLPCVPAVRGRRGVSRKALENGDRLPEGEITADQAFDEVFWPEYPRKRDKEAARKAWKSLQLKDTDDEKILAIMKALRRDKKEEWRDREPDKIPYGATWLRRKVWLDG